jgi:hypothetical protein
MKKMKKLSEKIQKKNQSIQKKLNKNSSNLKFKLSDPNRLNIYW